MAQITIDYGDIGGDTKPYIATTSTSTTIASSDKTKTFTATQDCMFYGNLELSYNNSGYIRIKLNGEYILNETEKKHYYPFIKMKSGDEVIVEYDSNSTSSYSVAY